MKLDIHLIPKKSWYHNLRKLLGSKWTPLSKAVRENANYTCEVCGDASLQKRDYHCHEVWEYDYTNMIQRLHHMECLCWRCHAVRHWGHSVATKKNMNLLLEHASRVNGISKNAFLKYIAEEFRKWHANKEKEWDVDLNLDNLSGYKLYFDKLLKGL